jgi:hypothetical protein
MKESPTTPGRPIKNANANGLGARIHDFQDLATGGQSASKTKTGHPARAGQAMFSASISGLHAAGVSAKNDHGDHLLLRGIDANTLQAHEEKFLGARNLWKKES